MVEREAKRLEMMKRRQEREMNQLIQFEVLRKAMQARPCGFDLNDHHVSVHAHRKRDMLGSMTTLKACTLLFIAAESSRLCLLIPWKGTSHSTTFPLSSNGKPRMPEETY